MEVALYFGYPLFALLRLLLCLFGFVRTRFRLPFCLWSIAAFLSLAVSLFVAFQQCFISAVGIFPGLRYFWTAAKIADFASAALSLIGLLFLVKAASASDERVSSLQV